MQSIEKTQEIAEEKELVDALVDRLANEATSHLKAFA
jgi:C4-dicarboxylate-specific signal transduction histidine kinase